MNSRNIQLLDCTLRDGGYLNDWEFGQNNYLSIYERLVSSNTDIIEVGFIDERRPYDVNKTIFPSIEAIGDSFGSIYNKAPTTVGMIDYGTFDISRVPESDGMWIDGIRVIFKKKYMKEAMEYCGELKKRGYKVFSQLVAVSDYNEEDFKKIIELVNTIKPDTVSMVDTYGLLYPSDVSRMSRILNDGVLPDISIGFHAHNNLQLGYANCIEFINCISNREIVVDATLFGMGKSAGNDPIELVADHLNKRHNKNYKIEHMLEAIDESVMDMYMKYPWGYKPFFYLAAKNECHPNYVSYFQDKMNYSVSDIDKVLDSRIDKKIKLDFKRDICEQVYDEYRQENYSDQCVYNRLKDTIRDKNILIIGPGKNIILQEEKVKDYIAKRSPICISINYIPEEYDVDYVFISTAKRYLGMTTRLLERSKSNIKTIATSNITSKIGDFDYVFDREPLLERNQKIIDNSFLMLLKILEKVGIKHVSCAGLDGYSDREDNYFDNKMEYKFVKYEAINMNTHIKNVLANIDMKVEFITYSHYEEDEE